MNYDGDPNYLLCFFVQQGFESSQINPSQRRRTRHGFGAGAGIEPAIDHGQVVFDRAFGDAECLGDDAAGVAASKFSMTWVSQLAPTTGWPSSASWLAMPSSACTRPLSRT